ncbi:MAG: hypothetical protein A2017_14130 [Lentisphaerae bacterium GWF2_44_16]|nr:MAG: hypothetical protein A2017_14130 [Lentisphaerae bacterium GWF2_44_16]
MRPFNLSERILLIIFFVGMARYLYGTTIQSGTDTYLYHFFYPATWIADGRISRVPLLGLPHEYFPIYGEIFYGWMMIPFNNSSIAIFLQLILLLAIGSAFLMIGEIFDVKRTACLAALDIMFYTRLISANSVMGYSDVLNGVFLTLGFALMLLSVERKDWRISILSGLILGASASIKLIGLMLTPLLTAFFSIIFFCAKKKLRKNIIIMDIAAFFAALPCYLWNWIDTGNPFYPVKVCIAGLDIFPNGIVFDRPAAGLGKAAIELFFSEGIWGLNYVSLIFYGAVPFAALAFAFFVKKTKISGYVVISLAIAVIGLFLVQIYYYPAMTGARQFIPLIMLSSLLLIPFADSIRDTSFPFCAVIVFLICVVLNFTTWEKSAQAVLILLLSIALLAFLSGKLLRKAFPGIYLLPALYIPYCFTISLEAKKVCYKYLLGPVAAECFDIVMTDYEKGKKVIVASVGGWYNYMFLEYMPGNKVHYIPISSVNSAHVHDFSSFREMRETPISYEIWLERLKKANADYLLIDLSSETNGFYNKQQELSWVSGHPESFTKLIDDGLHIFCRIKNNE